MKSEDRERRGVEWRGTAAREGAAPREELRRTYIVWNGMLGAMHSTARAGERVQAGGMGNWGVRRLLRG
jgi:hypothetical protein